MVKRVIFTVIPALIAYLACEAWAITTGALVPLVYRERQAWHDLHRPDATLGYVYREHLDESVTWWDGEVQFRLATDERGFRAPARPGRLWVGDSFTAGFGVPLDSSIARLVDPAADVVAVDGWGWGQYVAAVEARRPESVVVVLYANDLLPWRDASAEGEAWSRDVLPAPTLAQRSILGRTSLPGVEGLGAVPQRGRRTGLQLRERGAGLREFNEGDCNDAILLAIQRLVVATPDLALVLIPTKESAALDDYERLYGHGEWLAREERGYAQVCAVARAWGARCLDLTPVFRADQHVRYYPRDAHWTEAGHRLAAGAVRGWL